MHRFDQFSIKIFTIRVCIITYKYALRRHLVLSVCQYITYILYLNERMNDFTLLSRMHDERSLTKRTARVHAVFILLLANRAVTSIEHFSII